MGYLGQLWHKEEIPLETIENIQECFNQKADDQLLKAHLKDQQAHGLHNKVDKVAGKGLSSNDFTNQEKEKLKELQITNKDDTDLEQQITDEKSERKLADTALWQNIVADADDAYNNLKKIQTKIEHIMTILESGNHK